MANDTSNKEQSWKKGLKQFREIGKLRVSNMVNRNQSLSIVLEEFMYTVFQKGRVDGMGKQIPSNANDESSENEVWRIDDDDEGVPNSCRKKSSPRKKSAFVTEVLIAFASAKEGEACYLSHKEWIEKMEKDGRALSEARKRSGPRQILKRYGIDCTSGTIFGEALRKQAEHEGRDLTEKDIVFQLTKAVKK